MTGFSRSEAATRRRRLLVLDAETRTALAVVRSAGKAGHEIGIVGSSRAPLAAGSKYVSILFPSPDPRKSPAEFVAFLVEQVSAWKPDFLLPLTDLSMHLCLLNKDRLPVSTLLPCVSPGTLRVAADKHGLLELAERVGISVPKTLLIPGFAERATEDVKRIKSFPFPAVLKPQTSESPLGESFHRTEVYYPKNADEALSLVSVSTVSANSRIPFLLQERITGPGVGVFALCAGGRPAAIFCHRRVLEKPPSGGISVLSESIPAEEAPVAETLRLLKALNWDGVAMVEYKLHADGKFYLMEINPRFWGSLQLAVDSGRDFPALLVDLFSQERPEERAPELYASLPAYRTDSRLRWDLGTLDHALIRFKREPFRAFVDIVLRNALQFFRPGKNTRHETYRRDDPWPFVYELKAYFRQLLPL